MDDLTLLTDDDIPLVQREIEFERAWHAAKRYAEKVYGPRAAKLELEVHYYSDDEGGTYPSVQATSAEDAEGKDLDHDYTTPFWVELLAKARIDTTDLEGNPISHDEIVDLVEFDNAGEIECAISDMHCDLDGEFERFDLTTPPVRTFSAVYGRKRDGA